MTTSPDIQQQQATRDTQPTDETSGTLPTHEPATPQQRTGKHEDLSADAFAERFFAASLGALEVLSAHLGSHLGWYDALAEQPHTAASLARATGTDERYAREWLEQQAVCGILDTEPDAPSETRRYTLPAGAREVLTDRNSLSYLSPVTGFLVAATRRMPELLNAYRHGGGVSWEQFGDDARFAQSDMNRPWFEHRLPTDLASVPHLHRILSAPGARVAEIGFGGGWASIAMARAYPELSIDGYDIDAPSVELARRNAADAGVADRVSFHLVDGSEAGADGSYDAVFAFECVHDMPQPVGVLRNAREMTRPGGAVVVMEEAVADAFEAPGDDVERFMYGISLLICLPDGRSHPPSVATGTVIRPSTLEKYAVEAGFNHVDVLPIEDFGFWRFYQLHQ